MDEATHQLESAAPPPLPAQMSLAGRLFNVFATPGEVFDSIKGAPHSPANWLVPAVLLVVISWISIAILFSQPTIKQQLTEMADKMIEMQIQKAHVPEAQAEKMRQFADWGVKANLIIGPIAVAFATPFLWGLIIWLVGAKVLKGGFGYLKSVEVVGLANMIFVLDAVVRSLLIVLTGNLFASASLALLVKEFNPENTTHILLSLVNVMTFWLLSVRAIGLARLSGASTVKSVIWVFGIWIAYTGAMTGMQIASRAVFSKAGG